MKILVLGGSGFIGSQVCVKAVSEGHEVHALGRNKPNKVPEGVNWVSKDALDYEGMKSFLQKESFDAVVNCIGILFDYSTPLRRLNKLFSGSNSVALNNNETYSNIIEGISLNIYHILKDTDCKMVFMSAAETKWRERKTTRLFERIFIPKFLKEYLKRKRFVDDTVSEHENVSIFYPSIVYRWNQFWKLPVVMGFRLGSFITPIFYNPIHVDKLSHNIVQTLYR